MDQPEFVGSYRGYEIFASPVSGSTQYIAFPMGGGAEVARKPKLDEVMGVIDLCRDQG